MSQVEEIYSKFREQECHVRSVDECKKIYGHDQCEHEILEVKEV